MNAIRKTTLALLLCSAVQADACPFGPPPTAAQLREWAACDCVSAGKHAGIDYAHSLDRAIAEDPAGLAELFRFTDTAWFDGAAAEAHSVILLGLLQRWGDRPLSRVVRAQKPQVRKAVIDAIWYAFPYPTWKPTEFPLTYASAPH